MPSVLILTASIFFIKQVRDITLGLSAEIVGVSDFTQYIAIFLICIEKCVPSGITVFNFVERERICRLMNRIMLTSMSTDCSRKFEIVSIRIVCLISAIFMVMASAFVFLNLTLIAILTMTIVVYPTFVLIGFNTFMKIFENFFTFLLKDIANDLKMFQSQAIFDTNEYEAIVMKYQNIFNLNQEFNEDFGKQITTIVSGDISLAVMAVST